MVTAEYHVDHVDLDTYQGRTVSHPGVSLTVSFRLHSHEAALELLERAAADVRAQIKDTDA